MTDMTVEETESLLQLPGATAAQRALEEWAYRRGVILDLIHPGTPMENGHMKSFNGRLRDECLNVLIHIASRMHAARPRIPPYELSSLAIRG